MTYPSELSSKTQFYQKLLDLEGEICQASVINIGKDYSGIPLPPEVLCIIVADLKYSQKVFYHGPNALIKTETRSLDDRLKYSDFFGQAKPL